MRSVRRSSMSGPVRKYLRRLVAAQRGWRRHRSGQGLRPGTLPASLPATPIGSPGRRTYSRTEPLERASVERAYLGLVRRRRGERELGALGRGLGAGVQLLLGDAEVAQASGAGAARERGREDGGIGAEAERKGLEPLRRPVAQRFESVRQQRRVGL